VKQDVIRQYQDGKSLGLIAKDLGLYKGIVEKWIELARKEQGSDQIPYAVPPPLIGGKKVSDVRDVLEMIDEGTPLSHAARGHKITRGTAYRWILEPKYRDATFEYDPTFPYDYEDITDRAVVAQHLCTQTTDIGERLDLLFAVLGTEQETDNGNPPSRNQTRRRRR
jgi:DNA invertase Pin-like site-specific DNA recombinase